VPKLIPHIMGILNVTPDSFSDGGDFLDPKKAFQQAKKMIEAGADWIDVGGESTAPNAPKISAFDEWNRISNILNILISKKIPCSLDSYKAEIWEKFLRLGGTFLNDVSGLAENTEKKWKLLQLFPNTRVVVMFSQNHFSENLTPKNVMSAMLQFFSLILQMAEKKGIDKSRIILDPGMGGFLSSDPEVSFTVIRELSFLATFGCEILIGTSRKSFLREVSDPLIPPNRDFASVIASLFALQNGANWVRVHNVKMMKEAIGIGKKLKI
jgi:dihydropteroate synthase